MTNSVSITACTRRKRTGKPKGILCACYYLLTRAGNVFGNPRSPRSRKKAREWGATARHALIGMGLLPSYALTKKRLKTARINTRVKLRTCQSTATGAPERKNPAYYALHFYFRAERQGRKAYRIIGTRLSARPYKQPSRGKEGQKDEDYHTRAIH